MNFFSTLSDLYRNRTFFPSGIAFQLSIRDRYHPTRNTLHVGTFGFTAELFLTILFVTHVNILTSDRSGFFFSEALTSKSYRLPFLRYAERSTTSSPLQSLYETWAETITASASYLVSCICGAKPLILYVVTRFLTDGCFQAHRQVVLGISLPFALSMKFETLSIDLGCFPLNVQYLSTAVGLRSLFPDNSIHSLHLIGTLWHALTGTELYLIVFQNGHCLNSFRRKQAITLFV